VAGIGDVVFDCRHPASLARFWAAAPDGYRVAPYDEAELERLRAMGVYDPEDDPEGNEFDVLPRLPAPPPAPSGRRARRGARLEAARRPRRALAVQSG
jgi:hypothetical protein